MVVAFVPMYFIAVAYSELNKAEPDCGTTFTWAARAFGTRTGWMGGWGIIIADVIVMANLAQIAGSYSFSLVGADAAAASTFWSTVAGIVWIVVMTYICYRGIEVSARLQYVLLGVEVATLLGFAVVRPREGLQRQRAGRGHQAVASWLSPAGLSPTSIVDGDAHRGVHLLGLGHGGGRQRGVGRPGDGPRAGPRSSRPSCCS